MIIGCLFVLSVGWIDVKIAKVAIVSALVGGIDKMIKKQKFKPMLYANRNASVKEGKLVVDDGGKYVEAIQQDYLWSKKLDGCRVLIIPSIGIVSRSLKQIPNPLIHEKLEPLMKWCEENKIILDGEIFDDQITFQDIISVVMTKKEVKEVPQNMKFHCFDALKYEDIDGSNITADYDMTFEKRLELIPDKIEFEPIMKVVEQNFVGEDELDKLTLYFQEQIDKGQEGIVVRSFGDKSPYKCNRTTIKESYGFKVKEFRHEDAQIIDVIQATVVDSNAEKKTNELGHSVTSKKLGDRIPIEMASAFLVDFEGVQFKVSIAEDEAEKKRIWSIRDELRTGKHKVEFKAMFGSGVKDAPRHPTSVRLRMAEDEE